jgi:hypothetical protein
MGSWGATWSRGAAGDVDGGAMNTLNPIRIYLYIFESNSGKTTINAKKRFVGVWNSFGLVDRI